MSKHAETLAEIVAGMRYGTIPKHRTDHELLVLFADRIEAAAKRERGEWEAAACSCVSDAVMSGRVAVVREEKAAEAQPRPTAPECLENMQGIVPYSAPVGNAAAMREALLRCDAIAQLPEVRDYQSIQDMRAQIQAALDLEPDCYDATKMRDALEYFLAWYEEHVDDLDDVAEKCRAALAAPPRNCDRFGGDIDRLREACARERGMNPEEDFPDVFPDWLLAPSTEKKGEPDGSK